MRIADIQFVDLYLSDQYYDIKGLDGLPHRVPVPKHLVGQVQELHDACKVRFQQIAREEFSLRCLGMVLRITVLIDTYENVIFVVRRSPDIVRPINSLGYGHSIVELLMSREIRGLVLICGEMAAGKTSSASSLLVERMQRYGGVGIAIEDPNEGDLNGEHGKGRIIQLDSSRHSGGYPMLMRRAVRSGANAVLVGEIRDEESAWEALKAGLNGHLIISTIHGGGIVQGIERLQTFCQSKGNVSTVLADGLAVVIWQELERLASSGASKGITRLRSNFLVVRDQLEVKTKIREGKTSSVGHDIAAQATRLAWASAKGNQ
jgi:twitching motility protein PilT